MTRFKELATKYGLPLDFRDGSFIDTNTQIAFQMYLQGQRDEIQKRTEDEELLIAHQKEINSTLILAETRIRELNDLNDRLVKIVKQLTKTIGDLV